MNRLTENIGDFAYTYSGTQKTNKEYDKWVFEATCKLGKIEDLMEKYHIRDVEHLDRVLEGYKFAMLGKIFPSYLQKI